ncbi:MAG: hypothetical protein ABI323_04605, partial [Solirubrobacteraceae bacterium]
TRFARRPATGERPPDDAELLADGIIALAERWLYHNDAPAQNSDPAASNLYQARGSHEALIRGA